MNKIINGKRYNTDTAERVGEWDNGFNYNDFNYTGEELYRKKSGEFFLYGESGALGKYAVNVGNMRSGGEEIVPFSDAEARQWAEEHLSGDEYESIFGVVEEEKETIRLNVEITREENEKLQAEAKRYGKTKSEIIRNLIAKL